MAAKAVRIASGDTTYLPITTSDLVQMNGTTQSLTTYINNIKETVESIEDTNSAKMTVITKYGNIGQYLGTYAYISPTGDKDTENGSVLEIKRGDNIQISGEGDTITISALNSKVYQYTSGTSNVKYPFLTKYTNGASGNTNGGDYSRITSNGSDSSLFAYFNPSKKVSYFQYAHSTEFTENGVKLSDKYAEIGHVHYLYGQNESYTDDMGDTVNVMIGFVNNNTITTSTENNSPVPLSYYSYSVPTKKYVDDNFATKTELGDIQSGAEYTIVAASNSTTVNQALSGFTNAYLNLVNTTTNSVAKSIYVHGNNDGTSVAITGGSVIDLGINHTQDHIGSGTAGKLTYWSSNDNHSSVTVSYGSNTTNSVGLHYINDGVLKNVSATVGANDTPTYVSEGTIKPITTFKVTQKSLENTNTNKYPFLTKSNTTTTDITNTVNFTSNNTASAYYCASGKYAYFPNVYASTFKENGKLLSDKYAAKGHTHNYAFEFLPDDIIPDGFMPTGNTVTAIAYFNGDSSLGLIEDTTQTLRYASVILPTKKYIDTLVANSSSGNSAKVGWYYDGNADDQEDVYAYVGPTGTQADVTNGVGSAIHFKAGSYIYISYSGGAFNIGAINDRVDQVAMSNTDSKFPLLTKYSNANYSFENNLTKFSATSSSNIIAYVNPGKKILYSKYSYSDEYTENGQKLFNKYTTYAYLNSKLSNVAGKLDFTVVRSVMDDITII